MIEKKGKLGEFEELILETDLKNEETDTKLSGNLSKIWDPYKPKSKN